MEIVFKFFLRVRVNRSLDDKEGGLGQRVFFVIEFCGYIFYFGIL